ALQIGVARRQRESVQLAHRRGDIDLEREVQVVDHAADEHRLLEVLAAEHGDVGLHQVKQLGHHGQHAGEVAGTGRALEAVGHRTGVEAYPRIGGVHRIGVGEKQALDAALGGELLVPLDVARIGREVFSRPELERIHENAHHDAYGPLPG